MIRLHEAALLAYTKLRTRKVRLLVTVFISCLLFSVLASASYVFRGAFKGVENFNNEGFGKRYIVGGSPGTQDEFALLTNQDLVSQAISENKALTERKKAEAKRLGIEYDSASEQLPYIEADGPGGKEKQLAPEHPIARAILQNYKKAHPDPSSADLKKLAEPYGAINFYETKPLASGNADFALKVLKDGKEDYNPASRGDNSPFGRGIGTFTSSWSLMSSGLLEPFVLPGASVAVDASGNIPVVAPYTAVEQLLSLQPLPKTASTNQKLDRIKEVRAKATAIEFSVCYRNQTSVSAVDQAYQAQQELERNKNNKDYQKPALIYDLPKEPCGDVVVARDVRTADDKKLAQKQEEFHRTFGEKPKESRIIKFRVIGIAPDPPDFAAFGVSQIFSSILSSNIGSGWFTPIEAKQQSPPLQAIFTDNFSFGGFSSVPPVLAEFGSADQASNFIKQQNCNPDFGPGGAPSQFAPFAQCIKDGKPFILAPFGSSSLAIAQIKKTFSNVFRIAAIVVSVLAAIIMMGTLGRIIADSRRETAVFRAIGAKRIDIAQIYLTYSFMLSLLIIGLAIAIGFVIASIANARYSDGLTIEALLVYNAQDLSREIHLYAFELRDMLYLVGFALLAGLASAILPLASNIRRNPIRDMRDEN